MITMGTVITTVLLRYASKHAHCADPHTPIIRPEAQQEAYIVPVRFLHMRLVVCVFRYLGGSMVHSLGLVVCFWFPRVTRPLVGNARRFPPRLADSIKLGQDR